MVYYKQKKHLLNILYKFLKKNRNDEINFELVMFKCRRVLGKIGVFVFLKHLLSKLTIIVVENYILSK